MASCIILKKVRFDKRFVNASVAHLSFNSIKSVQKMSWKPLVFVGTTLLSITGVSYISYCLNPSLLAGSVQLNIPSLDWNHHGLISSLDHASVRRGYEVYKQVCSTCHSMNFMAYRKLVGVTHTKQQAEAEAASITIVDGPDASGEMFERPGKLSDHFPKPYKNNELARIANNGALPPDLSLIANARHGGEDYIFHLLTGYHDPPAGITLEDGQHYNPYFPGCAIGMAEPLDNEIIEYEDGTPATKSQLAKDVATFLRFTAEPEFDTRKLMFIQTMMLFPILILSAYYLKRTKWSTVKSTKIIYKPRE